MSMYYTKETQPGVDIFGKGEITGSTAISYCEKTTKNRPQP